MSAALSLNDYRSATKKIAAWVNPTFEKRPRLASFLASIFFHAMLFLVGGLIFVKAPEYGVDTNQGGVDIYLVAAPSAPVVAKQAQPAPPVISQEKDRLETPAAKQTKSLNENRTQGRDAVTFSSSGSGRVEEKPGYLKNPPPAYPSEAIQKGQEGLVLLNVTIDRAGHPQKVELRQGSGFYLLDESALKAVKKWKFSPARLGALTVDTQVAIPVRFRLEDVKKK